MTDAAGAIGALWQLTAAVPKACRRKAKPFHDWIEQHLKVNGFQVRREVEIRAVYPGGQSGFIDLVIDGQRPVGIELDWIRPRQKSIEKLRLFGRPAVIVLRYARASQTPRTLETIEQARALGIIVIEAPVRRRPRADTSTSTPKPTRCWRKWNAGTA